MQIHHRSLLNISLRFPSSLLVFIYTFGLKKKTLNVKCHNREHNQGRLAGLEQGLLVSYLVIT